MDIKEPDKITVIEFENGGIAIARGALVDIKGLKKVSETTFTKEDKEFELLKKPLEELDVKKDKGKLRVSEKIKTDELSEI